MSPNLNAYVSNLSIYIYGCKHWDKLEVAELANALPHDIVVLANNSVYGVEDCQIKNWYLCGGKFVKVNEGLIKQIFPCW
jgi:hypothetical protein